MVNWQEPQRQSAFGIFILAGKAFREMWAILLVAFGSLARKEKPIGAWLLAIGGFGLFIFGKAFLDYFFFRFHITEGQLIINKGIFSKKTLVLPVERIQTVQIRQNLLHKIINHCKLTIDSAGSEKTEVSIHAISYTNALQLKELLTQRSTVSPVSEQDDRQNIIRLAPKDLIKMAASANHLETFGLIAAFVLARFEDVRDLFGYNAYDWMEEQGKEVAVTTQMISILIFFALAFSILISVLRIVLKFCNLNIHLSEKGFQLQHGLLQSQQQFIGSRKIQYLQWNANWVRRKLGLFMLHLKFTGDTDIKKKQKIHIPVTRKEHLHTLTDYYQTSLPSSITDAAAIQPEYMYRRILFSFIIVCIAVAIAFIWWSWYALLLFLLLAYYIISTKIFYNNFQVWANENAIEISKGVWGRQRILLNWHNIQIVSLRQSIYQQRRSLATLSLQTASGEINIPFLKLEEAQLLANHAAMRIESSQKNWM